MGKLKDLCASLEGEALTEALIEFDYAFDTEPVVDADPGSAEWYNAVDDRPLGGADTFDELTELVALGLLDLEVYSEVIAARAEGASSEE